MSFNYDKFKHKEDNETFWVSYADLYTMLSVIFLMLYVISSVRSGTMGIQTGMEYQKLLSENEDLKQQINVYNTLKDDYLEKGATEDEQKLYNELMDKLSLLKDEAKVEKDQLKLEALELEKKELALNKYQQVIRNIVNSNMMAQSRIKKRDEKIVEVEQKGKKKLKDLKRSKEMELARIREEKEQELAVLEKESSEKLSSLESQATKVREELRVKEKALRSTETALTSTQAQLEAEAKQKSALINEIQTSRSKYQAQVSKMQTEYEDKVAAEKAAFEEKLASEKMSAAMRERELDEFKAEAGKKAQQHELRMAALNSKVKASEYALKKAQEVAEARGKLAKQIKSNFERAGIKAEVNADTGDVTLAFGEEYFDTGRADLKPGMKNILEEMMPVYAQSLFQNKEIVDKLSSVEIVGFASPTYKGKYVDPNSLNPEDKNAVNFNLDLSYYRAKSIFNHVFDRGKMSFGKQDDLMKLVKVTGRSFLAEKISDREVASGMSEKEFCKVYNCKKAQRVIIKFNLQD